MPVAASDTQNPLDQDAASPANAPSVPANLQDRFDKIVVAIHGIGDQARSATIRAVAAQFGRLAEPPLPLMPLGYFTLDDRTRIKVSRLELDADARGRPGLQTLGFAEVYWADIPRELVKQADTLEETKAWGKTVVGRAETLHRRTGCQSLGSGRVFRQAAGVVEEIVESVQVLENVTYLADKMGIFKFDVAPLLRDYVNDVQVVTEFSSSREKILARFHEALQHMTEQFQAPGGGAPEIYIVAHSEGTVVSFLALLQALAQMPVAGTDGKPFTPNWIIRVRGYMTIGSPIDKHITLWPRLWDSFRGKLGCTRTGNGVQVAPPGGAPFVLPGPIQWRNYFDEGDPIGFKLDSARAFLNEERCTAFEFDSRHDLGFARYPLPGKAHNDYWNDPVVFGHFIDQVVLPHPSATETVASIPDTVKGRWLSPSIPYIVMAVLHLAAVFVLLKGLDAYLIVESSRPTGLATMARLVLAFGALLTGVTVCARLPRVVKLDCSGGKWHLTVVAFLALLGGGAVAYRFAPEYLTPWLLFGAAIAGVTGWLGWPPRAGRLALIGTGVAVVSGAVLEQVLQTNSGQPVWPLLLAGAAFVYLWWLALLVFDLTVIWHRYIRWSAAHDALTKWQKDQKARSQGQGPATMRAVA